MGTARRKHNPEILRYKRIARLLGIAWGQVCEERDRLKCLELDSRESLDEARRVGWQACCHWLGWAPGHHFFWRSGFQRYYGRVQESGKDYSSIPHYDEIADSTRAQCPAVREWDNDQLWEFFTSDYRPRANVLDHYREALAALAHGAIAGSDMESELTPF